MAAICAFTNQIECPLHELLVPRHILARWKSAPRKCRCNSRVFHSSCNCALGGTEWLAWEEKWKEGGKRKGLDVYFIGQWLSPSTDRWFLLRSLMCAHSDNPYSLSNHKRKGMKGIRIWEQYKSFKLSKQLTALRRCDRVGRWRYTGSWLWCERAKQKDIRLLTLTSKGLLFQIQDSLERHSPRTAKFWIQG